MAGEGYDVGSGFLQLIPTFRGVEKLIDVEAGKWGTSAGKTFADAFNKAAGDKTSREPLGPSKPQSEKSGADAGGAFARGFRARIDAALKTLPDVKIGADSSDADRAIDEIRARLTALRKTEIGVGISAGEAITELESIQALVNALGASSVDIAVRSDAAKVTAEFAALFAEVRALSSEEVSIPVKVNEGAFAQKLRTAVEAAQKSLPDITLTADSSKVDREVAAIKAELAALHDVTIRADFNDAEALAKAQALALRLDALSKKSVDIRTKYDAATTSAAIQETVNGLRNLGQTGETAGQSLTQSFASFGTSAGLIAPLIIGITAALAPLGAAAVGAIGGIGFLAVGAVSGLGVLVIALSGVVKALSALHQARERDAKSSASNAAAQARQADQVVSAQQRVKSAESALAQARASAADAAVSAAERVKSAQQQVATAAQDAARANQTAARAVVDAQGAAKKAVADAADANAAAVDRIKAAEQSLAQAVSEAARARIDAAQRVADARTAEADAERSAASSIQNAINAQVSAEQSLARAQRQAQQAQQDLTEARKSAQQQLEDLTTQVADGALAQRQADIDLISARQALNKVLADPTATTLQRQQAQLTYDQARQQITDLGIRQQRLAAEKAAADAAGVDGSVQVRNAQQGIADAQQNVANSQQALAAASAAVDEARRSGAESVAKAQQAVTAALAAQAQTQTNSAMRVAAAQKAVADSEAEATKTRASGVAQIAAAQRALTDAVATQQRTQQAGVTSIANAQQSLADAQRASATQQRQSAYSVQQAQAGVTSALQALKMAMTSAGTEGAASMNKVKSAIAGLSPAGKAFLTFIDSQLLPKFKGLRAAAETAVLPGLQAGLKSATPAFAPLTKFITTIGSVLGDSFARAGKELSSPFWLKFFDFFTKFSAAGLKDFGAIFGNIGKGLAGLLQAFGPLFEQIGGQLVGLSKNFADFGANAGKNPAIAGFIDFISKSIPVVAPFVSALFNALSGIFKVLAPLGLAILKFITPILNFIGNHPDIFFYTLGAILGTLGAVLLAVVAPAVGGFALIAAGIALVVTGVTIGAALIARHWGDISAVFSTVWMAVMAGARAVAQFFTVTVVGWFREVWTLLAAGINLYLTPYRLAWQVIQQIPAAVAAFFTDTIVPGLQAAWNGIGAGLAWLRDQVFVPIWHAIQAAPQAVWTWVTHDLVGGLRTEWTHIQAGMTWLRDNVFVPIWRAIQAAPQAVWNWVTRYLVGGFKLEWVAIQAGLQWLRDNVFRPIWSAIQAAPQAVWTWIQKYLVGGILLEWQNIQRDLKWLRDSVFTPVWKDITAVPKAFWDWLTKTLIPGVKSVWKTLGDDLKAFRDGTLKPLWDGVKSIFREPIKFVIDTVLNKGIIGAWNWISQHALGGKLGIPNITLPKGFAAGTEALPAGPATPMITNGPRAIVGEGNPKYSEFVIPTDPKFRGRALGLYSQLGTQLLDSGGVIGALKKVGGGAIGAGKAVGGAAADAGKWVWDTVTDPFSWLKGKINGALGDIKGQSWAGSDFGKLIGEVPKSLSDHMLDSVKGALQAFVLGKQGATGQVIDYARKFLGTPYVWGGDSPSGFDCSGFVQYVLDQFGINAPRTSRAQYAWSKHISRDQAIPGDLVFYDPGNIHHVGFYEGNGKMIDAPHTGANIREEPLWSNALFGDPPGLRAKIEQLSKTIGGKTTTGSNVEIGRSLAAQRKHWTGVQFDNLNKLWTRESNWRTNADNPTSSAYGIPQALPGSKMASAGGDWMTNPVTQITWGLDYIAGRYGNPVNAWAHELSHGWYDNGGWLNKGLSLVANGTNDVEAVLTKSQFRDMHYLAMDSASRQGKGVELNVINHYPQAEPASVTTNRSLQFAAALGLGN